MLRELRPALLVMNREIRDQFRDWRIILPIVGLVIFFPFLMNFTAQQMLGFVNEYGANIIGERLVPFLLMIVGFFPISVSLVIALETFVGEKERGSIEPLLHTPLKDWQLYVGKLLSATVTPLFGSFLGMSVYLIGLILGGVPLPDSGTMVVIIALTIVQAIAMVSGAVVVSTQATSVRAANLLASFIVIPAALLIQVESVAMFWGRDLSTMWWIVAGLLVLSLLLTRVGLAHFRREELLGRELDVLNIRWGARTFRGAFSGGARNPLDWYRQVLPQSVRQMGGAILIVALIAGFGLWLGATQAERFILPLNQSDLVENLQQAEQLFPVFSGTPVALIWWQNVRAQIIGLVLGIFTFGILGVMPVLLTMGIAGYMLGTLSANGISPLLVFTGLVLPHGIIEIPLLILSNAAVLQLGAMMATPTPGRSLGEVWLTALAHWLRVTVGIVIPLLLVAAAIEAWVTPRIALSLLR
jgi:uncharacterized membrane protein SpoIIM required for sporulation